MYYFKKDNKFYIVGDEVFDDKETGKEKIYVTTQWGKIGSNGTARFKKFDNRTDALYFYYKKVKELTDKDYISIYHKNEVF